MRTAEQVVKEINSARGDGDKQGLRNTAALLDLLRSWPECPVIHVAGTNGKGSVCAMLSSVLTAAGYRTGLYTSPFLQTYAERVRINGIPITEEQLAKYGSDALDAAVKLNTENGYGFIPFELGTALAFHTFRQEKTDIIISETGLGGRLDPTNVIPKPAVCAITAIGLDHMQLLGNTLETIAGEKAGIIKPDVPAVCYPPETDEVRRVFEKAASEKGAPLTVLSTEQVRIRESGARGTTADLACSGRTWSGVKISLPGAHQVLNALVALTVLEKLEKQGIRIPEEAVYRGLADTFWPGRLEWHGRILMDGAHNAQGVSAFTAFTESHLKGKRKVLLTGVLTEKLSEGMLSMLAAAADEAVTVTPDNPRAMSAKKLCGLLREKGIKASAAKSLRDGLATAEALAGEDGVVLATGSLYFIGALRSELGLQP
ncbi:MAG: bifunctional folylpolyglutamate synthase/dihydrofolate synthase [Clostridia bacterium]|nr:bifunctional folylpolyglutamate synthase/dihydrofolate synthase [Clostridia bacterium]